MNRFGRYIQCTIQIYIIPRINPASAYSVRIPAIPVLRHIWGKLLNISLLINI